MVARHVQQHRHRRACLLLFLRLLAIPYFSSSSSSAAASNLPLAPEYLPTTEFCSQGSVSKAACATPPTYDSIQIERYLGEWYEIGSTARLKLQSEAGLVCCRANYSLVAPPAPPGQGAKIAVATAGLPRLGIVAALGVSRLSTAAGRVCSDAKEVCSLLGPHSPVRTALYDLSRVVVEISAASPADASALSQAIVNISSHLQTIESNLASMSTIVTSIQFSNGRLSQASGDKNSNLKTLNKSIRLALSQQTALTELVTHIAGARESILIVAQSLAVQPQYTEAAVRLLQAAGSIDRQSQEIMTRLIDMELELIAMGSASSSISADESKPSEEWATVAGQAVQNNTSPGKLLVSMQGFSGPYWIMGLEGNAEDGYRAALVYSCVQDKKDGELHEALFILSRAQELAQESIDRFLSSAKLYGISTDCQNPFLLTTQDCISPPAQVL